MAVTSRRPGLHRGAKGCHQQHGQQQRGDAVAGTVRQRGAQPDGDGGGHQRRGEGQRQP